MIFSYSSIIAHASPIYYKPPAALEAQRHRGTTTEERIHQEHEGTRSEGTRISAPFIHFSSVFLGVPWYHSWILSSLVFAFPLCLCVSSASGGLFPYLSPGRGT